MFGLTISEFDERGILSIDLRDLLRELGGDVERSTWTVEGVEAFGPGADALERVSDEASALVGSELIRLASEIDQIVDGKFHAFKDGDARPWVVIAAVDSAAYDVTSEDSQVLSTLKQAFDSAKFIPGMEPPID